jgi:hypothetical protein
MSAVHAHDIFAVLVERLMPIDQTILVELAEGVDLRDIAKKLHRSYKFVTRHMDIARQSAWRSEAEDSPNCSGQFAIEFSEDDRNDSQAASVPIHGILPTQNKVMNTGLSTSVTEASGATGNQEGFIHLGGGPKTGPASAADWVAEIRRIWAHGPASTLELARAVAVAKTPARHGQWQEIWKALPFSRRKADMLAAIGRRLDWVNWQTFADLPIGWSILYELSKLERPAFEEFVRQRLIRPDLKLWEAKQLTAQFRGEALKTRSTRAVLRARLRRLAEYFAAHLADLSADDRELAAKTLTRLVDQIRGAALLEHSSLAAVS